MEFSLHRQLKQQYASGSSELEVPLQSYRIDVVAGKRLIEIQHGSLASIRAKLQQLLPQHRVMVVKPLVLSKTIVRQDQPGGSVVSRRRSPKRGNLLDLFHELVYFTRVFPHRNLVLEVPLVEIEEWRYPGHGRRRRRRESDFQIEDQRLVGVQATYRLRTARDLLHLVEAPLPREFHTGHLADALQTHRWIAQRIAYCWREMGAVQVAGKQGNSVLYRLPSRLSRSLQRLSR